ncbi:hypothetical protein [Apibacter adventoris]|uniref:Uncharacterized protein n=1 Tax=Apibacter adventoris TaxID=1679466 RepID=A0A2S8A8U6_9FLAO|nr:hypothetical protein [Apibacter adventoris]PQL90983.1 hypothetical protein C4S77_08970 [Apibacter adventoris]
MDETRIWELIEIFFKDKFTNGEIPDLNTMIFLIGLQELGFGYKKYKKDEKMNLMHIAVCRLLEPFGYYRFDRYDEDNWPHYELIEDLPPLKPNEQTLLMKKAIVQYFIDEKLLE